MDQNRAHGPDFKTENCRILENEPMKDHTTFRIGGPARWFCLPGTEEALVGLLSLCRREGIPTLLIGRGSNLLFSDRGFAGAVISTSALEGISLREGILHAECGVPLSRLSMAAAEAGLAGMEFAHGIPGSVGGAVYMNAGAYGGEMAQTAERVRVLLGDGRVREMTREEMRFGYRTSTVQETGGIVLSADFALCRGDREQSLGIIRDLDARRREKQPLDKPSAGSFFKRPAGHFAGALIEQAGLKGFGVGGARVSEKHAGFIVNTGGATCRDVIELRDIVVERVRQMSGVTLETEVRTVGDPL